MVRIVFMEFMHNRLYRLKYFDLGQTYLLLHVVQLMLERSTIEAKEAEVQR